GAPVAAAPAEGGVPVAAAPAGAPGVAVPAKATAGTGQTKASRAGAGTGQPVVVPAADSLETRVAHQMPGPPALRVTSWSARPTGEDLLSIFGTVQNVGSRVTAAITVEVTLFDSEGTKIGTEEGVVSS